MKEGDEERQRERNGAHVSNNRDKSRGKRED